MLPRGVAAHSMAASELTALRILLPAAQTAAHLVVGACSCDFVRRRHPDPREDERHLRRRYAGLSLSRERIILELERHRRPRAPPPPGGWAAALVAFVAEHARNAGPTVYHLTFDPGEPSRETSAPQALTRTMAEVRGNPEGWVEEDRHLLVVR